MRGTVTEKGSYKYCVVCSAPLEEINLEGYTRHRCTECGEILYRNPVPGAGGLLVSNGNILLVRRSIEPRRNMWCIPSGFMEHGESPEDTLKREVKEETGLEVKEWELFSFYSVLEDPRYHCILFIYNVTDWQGEENPGDDAGEIRWFPLDNIPEDMAFDNHSRIIEQYIMEKVRSEK